MSQDGWVDPPMAESMRADLQGALKADLRALMDGIPLFRVDLLDELASRWEQQAREDPHPIRKSVYQVCAHQLRELIAPPKESGQ